MVVIWGIVFFITFVCGYWFLTKSRKRGRLPPGPKGVPIFGSALQLDMKKFALQVGEIGKTYGDAYTISIFNEKYVILNSYELIKNVMTSQKYAEIFSGRPRTFVSEYVLKNDEVLQTYSEEWAALRKIVFRGLKNYGTHLAEVEALTKTELEQVVSLIQNEAGKSVDPYKYINGYVTSIIFMLLTGRHLKHDDPLLQLCIQTALDTDYLVDPMISAVMTAFPWLRHFPFGVGKIYQRVMKNISYLENEGYHGRKNNKDRKLCFMDYMMEEKAKGHVTEESVSSVFLDLLAAGSGTSRSTLYSLLLVLVSKPDVQKKIQQEIDREIGPSRLPRAEDKSRMSYTQAVLWETFRLYPAAPFTIPHTTMEDVQIGDYFLLKDTVVFYNIWNVLHDEAFWENPWEFNPSRFLDDSGDLLPPEDEKRQRMIAFGVGKRLCIGEVLARLRIFLACITILQKFTLLPDPNCPLPSTDPRQFDIGVTLIAPRYKIIFKQRKSPA